MESSEKYFFELIQMGLFHRFVLSGTPNADEWAKVYDIANNQTLLGVLFPVIERLPQEQRPPRDILFSWYASSCKIREMNKQLNTQVVSLYRGLSLKGVKSSVLKGQGVALYYPDPMLRNPGDIDIWLTGGRKRIISLLKKLDVDIGEIVYHHVDAFFFTDTDVEVHFRPTWLWNPIHNIRLQNWFDKVAPYQMANSVMISEGGERIACPTRDFNAVFLLIHIYRHFFDEGIGLRQLMDYYYCIIRDGDNRYVVNLLKRFGLLRFASALMFVLHVVFGLPEEKFLVNPNAEYGELLLNEIMQAGNFGHFDVRMSRDCEVGSIANLKRKHSRNVQIRRLSPDEVFWEVPFKLWHYLWRLVVNRKRP